MHPGIVIVIWIVIVVIFCVIVGEIRYRYNKKKQEKRQPKIDNVENGECNKKPVYTLSSIFPSKEMNDRCLNFANNYQIEDEKKDD